MPGIEIGLPPRLDLAYRGAGWDLFAVILKNVLLTLVTLGIYTPWARTVRRKYVWRNLVIDGHPLDYTGTGKELFLGYLKVAAAYLAVFLFPQLVVARISRTAGMALQVIGAIAFLILVPFAIYWSRRFLLSRTRWRGIRFGLSGDAGTFAKEFFKGMLLTVVTLGLYGPVLANRVYGFMMRNTMYGSRTFTYDGPNREAFKIGIKGIVLTILTLGIYGCWYQAAVLRFRMRHTHFDGATARCDVTGKVLFKVLLVNIFGNALSLGIAFPWTLTYTLREIIGRFSLVGPVEFAQITQREALGNAAGDSLASALGVELGV